VCRRHHWSSQVSTPPPPLSIPHTPLLNSPADHPFRSLVTTLRAAEKFDKAHLSTPEVARLIDSAKFFYVEGYFLTHGLDCALEIAKKASESGKVRSCLAFDGTRCAPCSFSPRFSPSTFLLLSSLNSSRFNSSRSSLIATMSSVMRARLQLGLVPLGYPIKMISPPSLARLQSFPNRTPRGLAQSL